MNNLIKITGCVPELRIADIEHNKTEIVNSIIACDADVIVFPELCLTGYTCQDLFLNTEFIKEAEKALISISRYVDSRIVVLGAPIRHKNNLYNCAVYMNQRRIIGIVPKIHIPTYGEFYEGRWFASGGKIQNEKIDLYYFEDEFKSGISVEKGFNNIPFGSDLIFKNQIDDLCIGTDICEDLWVPIPPSSYHVMNGANLIVNLSASNEIIGKKEYRENLIKSQSGRCICSYLYVSAGTYESSSDLVFKGSIIVAENGSIIKSIEQHNHTRTFCSYLVDLDRISHDRVRMSTFENSKAENIIPFKLVTDRELESLSPHPFIPKDKKTLVDRCKEIMTIQALGLERRIISTGIQKLVIGISGGLDSMLALLVCDLAMKKLGLPSKNIIGITMPCYGTTSRTKHNSLKLMELLEITSYNIDIKEAVDIHLRDIQHPNNVYDITYENAQARERTQILFDIANQNNALVIGTGDLSELALGWCTYNGDHMSNYAVNIGIPKTLIKFLIETYADIIDFEELKNTLYDILNTPISPELLPADKDGNIKQKTEESIGKYDIHDFCLYHYIRNGFGKEKIEKLAKIAFQKEAISEKEILNTVDIFFERFKRQQFKRNCLPDGPKVGSISLSPRGDWRMPSDI